MSYRLTTAHALALRALDDRWVALLAHIGFEVIREADGWVTYDGAGTLAVVPNTELDDDDTLAQILLHELLHHLVQGPASFQQADWGLDNTSDVHVPNEHATLRLQAALLDEFGLRHVLVPTTTFRAFYEALPDTGVLATDGEEGTLARAAWKRLVALPGYPALRGELDRVRSCHLSAIQNVSQAATSPVS